MRLTLGLVLAIMILSPAASWAETSKFDELVFSKEPQEEHSRIEVAVALIFDTGDNMEYAFRKSETRFGGPTFAQQWADTKTCPQARNVLKTLNKLEMPQAHVALESPSDVIGGVDGVGYALEANLVYQGDAKGAVRIGNRIRLWTNIGTPLAKWVDTALSTLTGCWKNQKPEW